MKIVEIDPALWDRGRGGWKEQGEARVALSGVAGRCCMGFAALALGAKMEEIIDRSTWSSCGNKELAELADRVDFVHLYEINDLPGITDQQRIDQLNTALEHRGQEFRFTLKRRK